MLKGQKKLAKSESFKCFSRGKSSQDHMKNISKKTRKIKSTNDSPARRSPEIRPPLHKKEKPIRQSFAATRRGVQQHHKRYFSDSDKNKFKLRRKSNSKSRGNSANSLRNSNNSLSAKISKHFSKEASDFTTTLECYKIGKLLGKGSFGKVVLGIHKLTNLKVAIKAIKKSYLQREQHRMKVRHEILILKKLKNKFVVRILEVFESDTHLLIVMEYMGGGDMFRYIKMKGYFSEEEAKPYFWQILKGVEALHSYKVLHRDIKLDNILMDNRYKHVKICDFGVSKIVKEGKLMKEQCGTPAYLAPEIIADRGYEGFSVDIWSLGVLLYIMISGTIPFKAKNINDLHKMILKGTFDLPEFLSDNAKDLICAMLQLLPFHRISPRQALKHPWFTSSDMVCEESIDSDINLEIVSQIEEMGFSRDYVLNSLGNDIMNHATATYYLLTKSKTNK